MSCRTAATLQPLVPTLLNVHLAVTSSNTEHGASQRRLSVGIFCLFFIVALEINQCSLSSQEGVVMKEIEGNLIRPVLMMVALNDRWRVSVVDSMIQLAQRRQQNRLGCSFALILTKVSLALQLSRTPATQHDCVTIRITKQSKRSDLQTGISAGFPLECFPLNHTVINMLLYGWGLCKVAQGTVYSKGVKKCLPDWTSLNSFNY